MSKAELKLDWCSHEAAKYAVEHWHYSKRMPVGKMVKIGVWESGSFIGCVLFARGANNAIGNSFGLDQTEACELVRVALTNHKTTVSRILSIAFKFLRDLCKGIQIVVSYADTEQGHHGGIYQASNWIYVGRSQGSKEFFHEGRWKHNREVTAGAFGSAPKHQGKGKGLPSRITQGKHKYLYPLTPEMKARIELLRKPYPKRAIVKGSQQANADNGGSLPTRSLQSSKASSSSEINSGGL